jgi:hypothetical protein
MQELRIQLQELYTFVRTREWTKTFMSKGIREFIEIEQLEINKKIEKNRAYLSSVDNIVDRAKKELN